MRTLELWREQNFPQLHSEVKGLGFWKQLFCTLAIGGSGSVWTWRIWVMTGMGWVWMQVAWATRLVCAVRIVFPIAVSLACWAWGSCSVWKDGWMDGEMTPKHSLESGSGIRGYGQGQSLDQPRTATLRRARWASHSLRTSEAGSWGGSERWGWRHPGCQT